MTRTDTWRLRRAMGTAAALLALGALAACDSTKDLLNPTPPVDPLFRSYVALGNSITAGYQSGGINDSTQRESYAALFAEQANTRYAYAALAGNGCPPPIVSIVTGQRVGGGTSATECSLRDPAGITAALNNVAVPGANVFDPTRASTPSSNTLTNLVLGGETQVARALDARPTFVSIWIGNNDLLGAAVSGILVPAAGISSGITPLDSFQVAYDSMMAALATGTSVRGGALIGVVNPVQAPIFFPAATLLASPSFRAGFEAFAGRSVTVDSNCSGSASLLSFAIVSAIRSGSHPPLISCEKSGSPTNPVGDLFVLDSAEQAMLARVVTEYNTYIMGAASAAGFAYWDPNPVLTALRAGGDVPAVPNLGNPANLFGDYFTLDGLHPSATAHALVADSLIANVNARYGTAVPLVNSMLRAPD